MPTLTVRDYLELEGIGEAELAARVGVKPDSVGRRVRGSDPMPRKWARALGLELDEDHETRDGAAPREPDGEQGRGAGLGDDNGRAHDAPPTRPADARVRPEPASQLFDASSFASMVASIYGTAGGMVAGSDPFLGQAIVDHADAAGDAWGKWAAANPRVVAWLERMMIGTPAGEVIGVHVAIAFAYFLARSEHSRLIREHAAAEAAEAEPAPADAFAGFGAAAPAAD